jgi:formiminoglutamate deiminase
VSRYWCEWAWLGGDLPTASVLLTVDEGRITAVEAGAAAGDATRLHGLTLPGFANAHSHAFHRALRGRTQSGEGSFWTWRDQMYRVAETLNPDSYFELARSTYAEMLAAGYTAVGEFHYLHHGPDGKPYDDPNAMSESLLAAAAEVGIRITLLDTLYLHGGIGPDGSYLPPNPVQRRFSDGSAAAWVARIGHLGTDGSRVRHGAAIHSVRAVDPAAMRVVRDRCGDGGIPIHIHLSEQPVENDQCRAAHGRTPAQLLADLGILGERLTAVHATHLTDSDISLLGTARVTACFCPTTERDLADGVGPSRHLVEAGARLAIGSDSHAVIDPFQEVGAVELNERLVTLIRGNHSVRSLLEAGTNNGYAALGWPEGGRVESGALADLVTVGLEPGIEPEHMMGWALFGTTTVGATIVAGEPIRTSTE